MNRLRELRLSRNLTTIALGKAINLDASMITHIEKGNKTFSMESLRRACDFFGVSVDYLLGKSPEEMFNDFVDSLRGDFMRETLYPDGDVTQSLSPAVSEPIRTKIEILLLLRDLDDLSCLEVIRDTAKLQLAKQDFSTPVKESES